MEAIKYYVKGAFVGVTETPAVLEQQEELIADLTAKVADLVSSGRSKEEALGTAIASMGDLSSLVREFTTDEPVATTPAEKPVRTVEVYASQLRLHAVALSASGAIAALFAFSVLGMNSVGMEGRTVLLDLFLTGVGVMWTGYALWRFHEVPDAVAMVEVGSGKRLRAALMQWAGICVFAFLVNATGAGDGFWAWTIWVGGLAWPANVLIERRLMEAGKFLHPRVDANAVSGVADMVTTGASARGCA